MKIFKKWMVVPFYEEKSNTSIVTDDNINKVERLEILKKKYLNPYQNINEQDQIFKSELENTVNHTSGSEKIDENIDKTFNDSLNHSFNETSLLNNNINNESIQMEEEEEMNDENNDSTFLRGPGQGTRSQKASRLQNQLKNKRKLEKSMNTESPIKKKRVSFTPPNQNQIENLMDDIQSITKRKSIVKKKKKRLLKKPTIPDWVQTRLTRFINESKKKKNRKIKS